MFKNINLYAIVCILLMRFCIIPYIYELYYLNLKMSLILSKSIYVSIALQPLWTLGVFSVS
jgi:hypothetical protein